MNASDMEISYECLVEFRHYGSDWNNYQTVDTEVIVETADDLESLYIKLGTHKTNETPVEGKRIHLKLIVWSFEAIQSRLPRSYLVCRELSLHTQRSKV